MYFSETCSSRFCAFFSASTFLLSFRFYFLILIVYDFIVLQINFFSGFTFFSRLYFSSDVVCCILCYF